MITLTIFIHCMLFVLIVNDGCSNGGGGGGSTSSSRPAAVGLW
jgi:hypothetical protein